MDDRVVVVPAFLHCDADVRRLEYCSLGVLLAWQVKDSLRALLEVWNPSASAALPQVALAEEPPIHQTGPS